MDPTGLDDGRKPAPRGVEGVVAEQLPSGLYRVMVDGDRQVIAHATGGRRNFVRLLVGDRVRLELTARDVTRGRIIERV